MKAILTALFLGTAAILPAAPTATAATPTVSLGDHHYDVYYRTSRHDRWRLYGSYDCREEADRVAHHLRRHDHYFTKVRHHH